MRSITLISSSGVKYRSHTCENISATEHAVTEAGRDTVSSGFMKASTGLNAWELVKSFCPVRVLLITLTSPDSLPVAGHVRITPTGTDWLTRIPFVKKSHTSPS